MAKTAECFCGAWITVVDLPDDLAAVHGRRRLWVHADGDDRCYPDDVVGDGGECRATPVTPIFGGKVK